MQSRPFIWLMLSLSLWPAPASARRDQRIVPPPPPAGQRGRFLAAHPVPAHQGNGFCYVDVPHTHDYAPDHLALYQQVGDGYLFTGDPVPFGYEGPRTVYYGYHPVRVSVEVGAQAKPVYCFIRGPHHHDYAPPAIPGYKRQNNVVFYVGQLPSEFVAQRPRMERLAEDEYRPFAALRPKVVVTPPQDWRGEVWVAPPPPARVQVVAPQPPSVQVVAAPPAVQVTAPIPPSVQVRLQRPQTVQVVGPSPPRLHLVVPGPPSVIVAPAAPPGIIVVPGRGHHPGKHKGWYKHKRGKWKDDD